MKKERRLRDRVQKRMKRKQFRKLINDPKHWQDRANEMRLFASQVTDPKVKATASGAAEAYEKLATGLGQRAQR